LALEDLGALPSRRRHITDQLRAAIISGSMETGTVYSAPALAAQFGVSPTPVREAMIDLAKEGLVQVVRNKGFRVIEPSERELRDMLEVRLLLEVPTVQRVAGQPVAEVHLSNLRALAAATLECAEKRDVLGHLTADLHFHLQLLALWGNREIVETVRVLRSRARLYGLQSDDRHDVLIRSAHEHDEIVDRIVAQDAAGAADLMRAHISGISTRWAKD
jgi:DNA-binding GntR family transcriptional regulator